MPVQTVTHKIWLTCISNNLIKTFTSRCGLLLASISNFFPPRPLAAEVRGLALRFSYYPRWHVFCYLSRTLRTLSAIDHRNQRHFCALACHQILWHSFSTPYADSVTTGVILPWIYPWSVFEWTANKQITTFVGTFGIEFSSIMKLRTDHESSPILFYPFLFLVCFLTFEKQFLSGSRTKLPAIHNWSWLSSPLADVDT